MRALDLDLPLESSPLSRFVLWTTGALVFLAVLAFAAATLAQARLSDFAGQPRIVTVALPPSSGVDANARAVQRLLEREPGAAYANLVSDEELDALVAPWVEDRQGANDLPMPRLIDVAFNPGVEPDLRAIERKVGELAPGATVGDAGLMDRARERIAELVRAAGLIFGTCAVMAAVLAVAAATRQGLRQNDETVDLLRLMGARDAYVAKQFEHHALVNALRGGFIGFALGVTALLLTLHLPGLLGLQAPIDARLRPLDWVLLAMVPVVAALTLTLTARFVAGFELRRGDFYPKHGEG